MLSFLAGIVKFKNSKSLVLENQGVGFEVFVPLPLWEITSPGDRCELFCHLHVREDLLELYGFISLEEKNFFELLLSVSGVGPKSALQVLNIAKVVELQKAILRGDPTLLRQVSGIGQKIAERIVVELKNKMDSFNLSSETVNLASGSTGVFEALQSLGYSLIEIRAALTKVSPELSDENEIIKQTLKQLGRKSK